MAMFEVWDRKKRCTVGKREIIESEIEEMADISSRTGDSAADFRACCKISLKTGEVVRVTGPAGQVQDMLKGDRTVSPPDDIFS